MKWLWVDAYNPSFRQMPDWKFQFLENMDSYKAAEKKFETFCVCDDNRHM